MKQTTLDASQLSTSSTKPAAPQRRDHELIRGDYRSQKLDAFLVKTTKEPPQSCPQEPRPETEAMIIEVPPPPVAQKETSNPVAERGPQASAAENEPQAPTAAKDPEAASKPLRASPKKPSYEERRNGRS